MIHALIVDDHEIVIRGLTRVIELDGRIQVVGRAGTIAEARALCERLKPDVLLMDLRLPDSRGAEEISKFKTIHPDMKVVVITGYGRQAEAEAYQYGAEAFLTKELASDVIADTIAKLFGALPPRSDVQALSARERQVARLVASGLTNPQVAEALMISPNTVKTHLASVLEKLKIRDRVELTIFWREQEKED